MLSTQILKKFVTLAMNIEEECCNLVGNEASRSECGELRNCRRSLISVLTKDDEPSLADIGQHSKIVLRSQQAAEPFSPPFPIDILRMRSSFLTRTSHRGTIVFVSQAK
jgi:hypothetical protein